MSLIMERLVSKEAAARYLGVSVRAVERYTVRRKLTVRRGGGDTGAAAYAMGELRNLKSEMEARTSGVGGAAVLIGSKTTLTLDEATAISGVARQVIIAAILDGRLAAELTVVGYEVRREELEAFSGKL